MDISSLISGAMGQQIASGVAEKMGIKNEQALTAISMAVPILLKAIQNNTSDPQGLQSFNNALETKHSGGLLANITQHLTSGNTTDGTNILGHILGEQKSVVEQAVAKSAGIDANQTANLMATLAPIVMNFIGGQKKEQSITSTDGVSGLIGNLLNSVQNSKNTETSGLLSIAEKLLDKNGDGSIVDDVANMGMNFLKNLSKK